jgi:hypothetical protein
MTFFERLVVGILLDQPGFAEMVGCLDFGCDEVGPRTAYCREWG